MTEQRKRRLRVTELDEISFVDRGANPRAEIALLKRDADMNKVERRPGDTDLDVAIREMQELVDEYMLARQGARGPIYRDVAVARVLAENAALASRIESLSRSDQYHKAAKTEAERIRKAVSDKVAKLSRAVRDENPQLSEDAARGVVYRQNPQLLKAMIEKPASARPRMDATISALAAALGGDDLKLGHRLLREAFPSIHERWIIENRA